MIATQKQYRVFEADPLILKEISMNDATIEIQMRKKLNEIYSIAHKRCGSSYELFLEYLSNGIRDEIMKNSFEDSVLFEKIATDEFEYIPNHVVKITEGCCKHGIEIDCCPAGCGG